MNEPTDSAKDLFTGRTDGAPPLSTAVFRILQEEKPDRVINTICGEVCRILGADASMIQQIRPETGERRVLGTHNIPDHYTKIVQDSKKENFMTDAFVNKKTWSLEVIDLPTSDPRLIDAKAIEEWGVRTLAVLPFEDKRRVFGVIFLYYFSAHTLSAAEEKTLLSFSHLAAIVIEKAQLLDESKRRSDRLEIAERISRIANSTLNTDEMFRVVTEEIRRHIPCDWCIITTVNFEHKKSHSFVKKDAGMEFKPIVHLNFYDWIEKHIYIPQKTLNITDLSLVDAEWAKVRVSEGVASILFLPIFQENGQPIAHFTLLSKKKSAFTREHEELLASVALPLASVIRNMTLFEESGKRAERLKILNRLGIQISQSLDISEVLQNITDAALELFQGDHSRILLLDENSKEIRSHTFSGLQPSRKKMSFKQNEGLTGKIFATGEPVNIPDLNEEPSFLNKDWARKRSLHSYLGYPLKRGNQSIGTLIILSREKNAYTQEDVELMGALAFHAGISLENANIFQKSNLRASRLAALQKYTRRLSENLDLDDLLQQIVESTIELLDGDISAVFFKSPDSDEFVVRASHGVTDKIKKKLGKNGLQPGKNRLVDMLEEIVLVKSGKGLLAADIKKDFAFLLENARVFQYGMKSYLATALIVDGEMAGYFNCFSEKANYFTEDDLDLLVAFAAQAAAALQNARLHEETARSRNFLQSVVGDNAEPIMAADLDGRIILWNEAATSLFGYGEEEVLGRPFGFFIPEDQLQQGTGERNRVIETGKPATFESVRRKKDGSLIPLNITISTVRDSENNVIAISAFFIDLTEFKRAEAGLANAQRIARLGNWEWDISGGNTWWSDEIYRLFGLQPQEFEPAYEALLERVHPDDRERVKTATADALERKTPYSIEYRILLPGGTERTVEEYGEIALNSSGEPIRMLGTVQDITERKKTEEEIRILNENLETKVIERTRELERKTFQVTRLNEIARDISSYLGQEELFSRLTESTAELMCADVSQILLLSPGKTSLTLTHIFGQDAGLLEKPFTIPFEDDPSSRAVKNRETVIIDDLSREPAWVRLEQLGKYDFRSYIGSPLIVGGEAVGVLNSISTRAHAFKEEDTELLEALAAQVAVIMQNAEAFSSLDQKSAQIAKLSEINQKLSSVLEPAEVLSQIARSMQELLPGITPAVLTYDPRTNLLRPGSSYMPGDMYKEGEFELPLGEGLGGWAAQRNETLFIRDARADARWKETKGTPGKKIGNVAAIPLMDGPQLLGLVAAFGTEVRDWTNDEKELLTSFASQAVITLRNARAFEQVQQKSAQIARLNRINRTLSSLLDTKKILAEVVDAAEELISGVRVRVLSYDEKREALIWQAGFNPSGETEESAFRAGAGVIGQTIANRESAFIPDIEQEPRWVGSPWTKGIEIGGYAAIPLEVGGNLIGALSCFRAEKMAWTDDEKGLLISLAAQSAIAIRNAQLLEELRNSNQELADTLEELKTAQSQLVQSEKMASLGGLVAGIAHEINTPVGVGVTAASHLQDRTQSFSRTFSDGSLRRSDLENFIRSSTQSSKIILENLSRAASLIRSFKQVAVDQTDEGKREFNLKEYLSGVILSLRPALKKSGHNVTVDCDDSLIINGYPGPLSQVITNLMMNSIIHGYEDGETGNMTWRAKPEDAWMVLTYTDDGKGVPEENLERIFEPFYTTKRGEGGSGLGMHIVYNIVTQTLGGTIECKSSAGEGIEFVIAMPI